MNIERLGHFIVCRDADGVRQAMRVNTVLGFKEDVETGSVLLITRIGSTALDVGFEDVLEAVWR